MSTCDNWRIAWNCWFSKTEEHVYAFQPVWDTHKGWLKNRNYSEFIVRDCPQNALVKPGFTGLRDEKKLHATQELGAALWLVLGILRRICRLSARQPPVPHCVHSWPIRNASCPSQGQHRSVSEMADAAWMDCFWMTHFRTFLNTSFCNNILQNYGWIMIDS